MFIDFETRSPVDLKARGPEVYARHPLTEVLCLAWGDDPENLRVWEPGQPLPRALLHPQGPWHAHNAAFEETIWRNIMVPQFDAPERPLESWVCTQANALYAGLPGRLDTAVKVLGLAEEKDGEGHRLMLRLSKPAAASIRKKGFFWPPVDGEARTRLLAYCEQDVRAEMALAKALPPFPASLLREYHDTLRMNQRGVCVDVAAAAAGARMLAQVQSSARAELRVLTGGAVETENQRDRFLAWAAGEKWCLPNLAAETVTRHLDHMNPPGVVRRALEIRQRLAKASTHKLHAMLRATCEDGRARGLIQWHGATTGRDAGRLIQPQNFPRPSPEFEDFTGDDWERLIAVICAGDADTLEAMYGDVPDTLSNALRAMLTCDAGNELAAADLAGIENRVIAAYGGEEWKLREFRDIDRNGGRDIYCRAAEAVFGFEVNKKDHPVERQVGKVLELSAGYQGWINAWRQFDNSDKHSDEDVARYMGAWRDKHPGIVGFWRALEAAAKRCVLHGAAETHGLAFRMEGGWMTIRLPSGRKLWYRSPRVVKVPHRYDEYREDWIVRYEAWRYGQWRVVDLYGGLLAENVVQATARDILFHSLRPLEAAGYLPVLRVHDEVVTEQQNGVADVSVMCNIIADPPVWAKQMGIPLAASGWIGRRYRK